MTELSIYATVSGNIKQNIELNTDIDPNEFVDGLKNGKYATTIGYGTNNGHIIRVSDCKVIGRIVTQEPLDDVEISDFELQEL